MDGGLYSKEKIGEENEGIGDSVTLSFSTRTRNRAEDGESAREQWGSWDEFFYQIFEVSLLYCPYWLFGWFWLRVGRFVFFFLEGRMGRLAPGNLEFWIAFLFLYLHMYIYNKK